MPTRLPVFRFFRAVAILTICFSSRELTAAVYEIGPGRQYANIEDAPLENIKAGDTILIHAREQPYLSKFVIAAEGSEQLPIVVRGVPGADGVLPVIDGRNAVTRSALNYWNEDRGVIKIGGANRPAAAAPAWILVENLDIRSGRPPYQFTGRNGLSSYLTNAAAIYVESGQAITIRNCRLHDSGNGLFVAHAANQVLVQSNHIFDNGMENRAYEHNSYTEAAGIVFEFNHYGPLRAASQGNNLKDRSAGTVIRYNWIESGNRQLDLVDSGHSELINAPAYRAAYVYGNVLIEPEGAGNSQIVHYGGDSWTAANYRKGTLHFYNNTVVSTRSANTTLFRLSTNEETADVRNNIFYVSAAGSRLAMLNAEGLLHLRNNWSKPGWVASHSGLTGRIFEDTPMIAGPDPGFRDAGGQDFRLLEASPLRDAGAVVAAAALPLYNVAWEYIVHQRSAPRPVVGALDLGAFEFGRSDALAPAAPARLRRQ